VFIHGWTCDLTFWRLQAPVYEKQRSLLIDLPGHGASGKPEIAYTQELFARSVDAVMRDAGVEKAVLVGHSMGASVIVAFLGMYPQKAAGVVIADGFVRKPPADDAARERRRAQDAEFVRSFQAPDYKAVTRTMIESFFTAQTPPELRKEILDKMQATPQYVVVSAMRGLLAFAPPAGPVSDVPAMAIVAKRSDGFNSEILLRGFYPNLRIYQEWDGAGHFLMMEQPERFNAALREFLNRK
jgi:pimeloyl-ACP methyl ester carboxylesterase